MRMQIRAVVRAVAVLAIVLVSCPAFGTTKTWNGSSDENWSNPSNWTPSSVPGSSDDVTITSAGTGNARVDFNATVNSVTVNSGATLWVQPGQTLTLNNASAVNSGGQLVLDSGNVSGNGALTVNGDVDIGGGTLGGSGALTVNSGAVMFVFATSPSSVIARTTANAGTITIADPGGPASNVTLSGVTLTNTGTIDFQVDYGIAGVSSPILNNNSGGVIKKTVGSGTSAIGCTVNNAAGGSIQAQSGTLTLNGGGTAAGAISISSGQTLALNSGTFTMSGSPTVSGTGTLFIGGATLDAGVNVTIPNLDLSTGTITGAGTLHVSDDFTWGGGTITGSGQKVVNNTSTSTIGCSTACTLDGATLQLQASVTTFTAGSNALVFSNGASLIIDSGDSFRITHDGDFSNGGGAASSVVNNGTIDKRTFSGTSTIAVPVTLSVGSEVDVKAGTLQFGGGGSVNAGVDFNIDAGTTLEVNGGVFLYNSSTVLFSGLGDFKVSAGTMRVPTGINITIPKLTQSGGVIDGGGSLLLFGTATWSGGTMGSAAAPGGVTQINSNVDILNIAAGGAQSLTQSRQIVNNGTLNYAGTTSSPLTMSANGKITNNNALNLTADGNINLSGSALIENNGTILKTAGTGTSTIVPPLDNKSGGTVSVSTGTLALAGGGTERGAFTIAFGADLRFTGGTFTMLGSPTITGSGNFFISSATVDVGDGPGGGADVWTVVRPITFFSGTININDATLQASSSFSVSGTIEHYGGAISGSGFMIINNAAVLNCRGTQSPASIAINSTINSGGRINFTSNAFGCGLSGNVTVTNNGTIDFQSDGGLATFSGAPQLTNSNGTIQKSAGSGTSGINIPVTSSSGSTVQSTSGTLALNQGGSFTSVIVGGNGIGSVWLPATASVSGTTTLTGKLELAGNATLGGTLNASGTLLLDNGVDVTWPNVNLSAAGSKIDGAGTLRVSGNFTWAGGTITGSGPRVLNSTSTPAISCSAANCALDGGTLQIQAWGTYSASGNALVLSNGASLILDPGKVLFVTNDGDFVDGGGAASSISIGGFAAGFNGCIEKTTTSGTSIIGVPVTMSGSFKVVTGRLQVNAGVTAAAGAIVHYDPGTTLELTGGLFLFNSSAITFPANGDFKLTGGTLRIPTGVSVSPKNVTLQGATIDGGGTVTLSGTSSWTSGTMGSVAAPGGTTQIASGSTLNVAGGTQSLAQGRVLLNDGTVNLTGDGNVNVAAGGTIANNGTLTKNGGSGTSTLSPAVNSTGTVSATSGTLALAGGGTLGGSVVATAPATIAFPAGTPSISGSISGTGTIAFSGAAVTVTSPFTIPTLSVTAGTVTLDASGSANAFTLAGGTLDGSGTLTLTNGGTWSGGTMSGGGTTINSATLGVTAPVTLNRVLQNNGTLAVSANVSGSGTIDNQGILNTGANAAIGATLNNNGQLATSNALSLTGGGTHGGTFTVTAPGNLSFAAGTHAMTGGSIGGTGTLTFSGATATVGVPITVGALNVTAGTATLNANGAADAFNMSGGTLGGSGTFTVNSGGTWSGGTMSGSGTTVIASTLGITAPVTLTGRTLQNSGTLSVSGDVAGSGAIDNQGTLNAVANVTIAATLNNNGQLATSNALSLTGGGTHGGTFTVTAPGNLSFAAGTHAMTGGTLSGTGTLTFSGATATVGVPVTVGTLDVSAGTATLNGASAADAFTMSGGTLGGSGTLTLTNGGTWSGGTMSGVGTTVNPSTLNVTAPVTLSGRTLQNGGTLTVNGNIAGSGTIDNQGIVNAGANVNIGAVLNNNGQLATSSALALTGGGTHGGSFTVTAPGNLSFAAGTHALTGGTLSGSGTLTFSGATATVGVPVTVGTLAVTAGTATLNAAAAAGAFTMNGGTLGGSGTLTLTNGGTWSGGTMGGSGTTVNPATLNITAPVTLSGRTLQNDGTLSVSSDIAGNGAITNNGTLSAVANSSIGAAVNGNGPITSSAALALGGGGAHPGTLTANGPASVIDFSGGTHTISGAFAGTGTFRFSGGTATVTGAWSDHPIDVAGGSVALDSNGSIPALTLSGGTLTGSGDLTVAGASTWSGGTIAGSGALTFDAGFTVTMPGTSAATLSRALSNKGTIDFTAAANGLLIDGVAVTNSGTFDVQSAQNILATPGTPPFANTGTLKKSAGANMQFGAPLSNSGLVQIESGTMNFTGAYVQSGGTTTVVAGTKLQTATFALNSGTLGGNGTVVGTVNNQAKVAPGASPGTLTIDGDYVQGPSGSLGIQLAGTTAGTEYDRLVVTGKVTLGGTLNVSTLDGFTPIVGNTFQIISYGSRATGSTFATMNGLTGDGAVLVPTFSAADLQLIAGRIQADMAVSVAAPAAVAPGSAFAYTIKVVNGGGSDANGVNVTAVLPPNVTFTGASAGVCSGAPNLVCSLGHLSNQSSVTVIVNVTAAGTGAAPVSVFAAASEFDPNAANNAATASTVIGTSADLRVAVAGPAAAVAGAPAIYTIVVTNDGPDAAGNVAVSATASAGLAFSANSGACTGGFPCTIAALGAGESAAITSAWNVASSASGSVQLAVSAASPDVDPNSANNAASATTQIGVCPTIVINAPKELTAGKSAEATATLIGGATYAWSIANGTIDNDAGTNSVTFTAGDAGPATLTVHVTGVGCIASATFPLTVKALQPCVGTASPTAPVGDTTTADAVVAFGWSAVDAASGYRLWLQQGDAPAQSLGTTLGTTLTKIIPPGKHRWYVETLFDGCASHESERLAFTVLPATDCDTHERPQPAAPENDATLTTPTIAFHWNAVPKALQYELWLAVAGGIPTLIRTTTDTAYTASVPPGRLEWFVRAVFGGCAATESTHRTFTYTPPPDCAMQRPLLIEPAEGERVTSPASFEWSAVPGATSYELYVDGVLAKTTSSTRVSGITVARGERRWRVRARQADVCPALEAAEGRFAVIPAPQSCSALDAPVVTAPAQISSGVHGRIQWSLVPGATAYVVQISGDPHFAPASTSSSTVTARQLPFTFTNEGGAPAARYVRVHAVDTTCAEPASGPFSPVAVLSVLPPGRDGVALMSDPVDIPSTLDIGAELAGLSFTATPTVPWITVTPASGIVPPGGQTLRVVAHTAGLPAGASTGTVDITTSAAAGARTPLGTTVSHAPVTVNNVPGMQTAPKSTPSPDSLVIPAVANVHGIIVRYDSDVWATNTSTQAMRYAINFVPSGPAGLSQGQKTDIPIAPGAVIAVNSIIKTWFGGQSQSGTLEIRPTESNTSTSSVPAGGLEPRITFASSRTFNITSAGTYGQYVPAVPYTNFVPKGTILSMQQIAQSDTVHTNLGLVEGSGEPVTLQVRIYDAAGAKLAEFDETLNGGEHKQINAVLEQHHVALDDGRIEVEVVDGAGRVTAYASVIDNGINDPLLVPPVIVNTAGHDKWVVPGVKVFADGAGNWQTDVRLFNAGSETADLTLAFHSQNGGEAATRTLALAPGEVRQLDRVLASFFGLAQDAGALHVTSAATARLVVTARTYNDTGAGAYGQFISAVTPEEAVSVGSRPLQILQVEESASYRSDIGFAEVSGKAVTLEVSVFPPAPQQSATLEVKLGPNEVRQIDSLLATVGLGNTSNARISVRAVDGEGRATAYLSLVDLKSHDPTYVPGQ